MTHPSKLEFLQRLVRHGVPFFVIGGHAVNFHGYVRATEDVDVVWIRTPESEDTLFAVLSEVNARWISDDIDPASGLEKLVPVTKNRLQSTHRMMLSTDHGFVDLFDFVPGHPQTDVRQVYEQSQLVDGIRFVSLQWLRRMKQASGRPQDLADLENLKE